MESSNLKAITYFDEKIIAGIALPQKFTFPFFYEPHPLTILAASQLQKYLETQTELDHNFGLSDDLPGPPIGKMFGVLVVQDDEGKLGYLSAFSGKLAGSNNHPNFVPPVFDMLVEDSFFVKEQEVINSINTQVKAITGNESYQTLKQQLAKRTEQFAEEIAAAKKQLKINKDNRKILRAQQKELLNDVDYAIFEADLIKQSLHDKHQFNVLLNNRAQQLEDIKAGIAQFEVEIEALKNERRERSATLQQQLFEQYVFLNKYGQEKNLEAIFKDTIFGKPPAAAGECATPKLLQYAFLNQYKPLAMAEFWWGAAPKSEVRQHKQYYPACTGKCKPILGHMLHEMVLDDNPLLNNPGEHVQIEILYEDDEFVVVNKPYDVLSVPGANIHDSVYTRLKAAFVNIEPLIIHRLDMATSGLIVVAKTKDAHKRIQAQFLKRTVVKRYTALLSKKIVDDGGEITLPLRGDLENRPRQLVCFESGKKAVTRWQVIGRDETTTKVHFWPLTGRTHQLRMHAAHELGLNAPIVGDDLYGSAAGRLYLQATYLEFIHPVTKLTLTFEVAEEF
ncbi:RluA family pseudouridine synthase [Mucilaginibacter glaciei]|uniref:RNA pseudouridine synthase n=1 Tax=Mucilaginibacter glaciei TaxID=2772109 RepID=A0A926S019_9SPHI|nr:RluA family pseudouridine synthase [Mucilaginibacter glaciei]MBD1391568.1 RNA pseudouridine synthase [Mucilaginibacter glaciei]